MDFGEAVVGKMLHEYPAGKLSFAMFLTMMGQVAPTRSMEAELLRAFEQLDTKKSGHVDVQHFKQLITTSGDLFTEAEVSFPK